MDERREVALVALQLGGGGPRLLSALEAAQGAIETWWAGRRDADLDAVPLSPRRRAALLEGDLDARAECGLARLRELGYRLSAGAALPPLAGLPEPPLVLFEKGDASLADRPILAVVGARRATGYGLRTARRLAGEVAAEGVVVVSGLARGIDGAAHWGALEAGGTTVAVLGAGPDVPYPPEHAELLRRIEAEGRVVTEHLPGTPPLAHHFPRRNRILVALAQAILVVEARLASGTLTSVRWAADLGRDVLVVPGPIDSALSEGPIELLREGATPVGGRAHLLEALGVDPGSAFTAAGSASESRDPAAARVLALLEGGPLDLDELVRASAEPPGRVLSLVLALEAEGRLARDASGAFQLTRAAGGG